MRTVYPFRFDRAATLPLAVLGIRPATSRVVVDDRGITVDFGRWHLATPIDNIRDVQTSGPYTALKVIGPRGSFADLGVTFGSSTAGGVCVCFHAPVGALVGPLVKHPGMTVTVVDVDGLAADLRARAGLSA